MTSYLIKLAALGGPAALILLWWKRTGIVSKGLHTSSWTNLISYPIWLLFGVLSDHMARMFSVQWISDSLVGLLIAAPLIAAGFSLVLTVWSRFAVGNERWKMATANGFMLALWLSSLIAPN